MNKRSRLLPMVLTLVLVFAACAGDDGGEVRDLGSDGSPSGSASGSGSGSGSSSGIASASDSSSASGSTADEAIGADGGYEYATDVSAHRLLVEDVCEMKEMLDADPLDYSAIESVYVEGEHSVNSDGSVRTLAGFATAEDRLHGLDLYYETATPLDDFVSSAIAGDGAFAGVGDGVRVQAIEKGAQNQIMVAWVHHELASALAKGADGDFDPEEGAVHNWDEAWAFYHGAAPDCAPYATANSRGGNFDTLGTDGETARTNEQIMAAMIAGRDALLEEDVAGAEAAADLVRRALFITYSQAAIRYASLVPQDVASGDDDAAAEHRAEGLAFWRVIEAQAAEAGADIGTINDVFDPAADPGSNGGGDDVRAALTPAWDTLGISDDDIGEMS